MSTAAAIAAVTRTLVKVVHKGLDGYRDAQSPNGFALPQNIDVTTRPPDKLRDPSAAQGKNQLNLFLYETQCNAAWRNLDPPDRVRSGETGTPPLALNLRYLVTPTAEKDDDDLPHVLLGIAMSTLHDHPILGRQDFEDAGVTGSGLGQQFERIRLTPVALSLEEMSKLWTTFQTQYRLSAAYEATVVLIDSRRPVKSPQPVLRRGDDDRGVTALASAAPSIAEVRLPRGKPSIELGEQLVVVGQALVDTDMDVVLTHALSGTVFHPVAIVDRSETKLVIQLPAPSAPGAPAALWPAGVYTIHLVHRRDGRVVKSSNAYPFALGPKITVTPIAAAPGDLPLTVHVQPVLRPGQRVSVLVGACEMEIPTPVVPIASLIVTVPAVGAGTYVVRLRVDGVDSVPLAPPAVPPAPPEPPHFDPAQTVKVA